MSPTTESEREAERIRGNADKAERASDHVEAKRLRLIAEAVWPSDPVQRAAEVIERAEISAAHPQTISSRRPHRGTF